MNELVKFLSIILEALTAVFDEYKLWVLLVLVIVGLAFLFYRIIVALFQGSPKEAMKSRKAIIEKIANLTEQEIEELRGKNQPEVVDLLVRAAKWTLREARALEQNPKPRSNAALREMRRTQQEIDTNLMVLPERYAAVLSGKQFSEFDPNKKIRKL